MNAYLVIVQGETNITDVQIHLLKAHAQADFDARAGTELAHIVTEPDDLANAAPGTLAFAGDDVWSVSLIERRMPDDVAVAIEQVTEVRNLDIFTDDPERRKTVQRLRAAAAILGSMLSSNAAPTPPRTLPHEIRAPT